MSFTIKCDNCGAERQINNNDKLHTRDTISFEYNFISDDLLIMCDNPKCKKEIILK